MSPDTFRSISSKYCPRFGQLAVEMGFITVHQMEAATSCQIYDMCAGRPHRLLGRVLLDKEWMTGEQIELVLNKLMKTMRIEGTDVSPRASDNRNSKTQTGECNG